MSHTPLVSAVLSGDIKQLELLLCAGANINQNSDGLVPLQYAIKKRRIKIIRTLIENGANLSVFDDENDSPLKHIFLKLKQKQTLSILEVMPNRHVTDGYDKSSALHYAARCNYIDCVRFLIQNMIKVNGTNSQGQTPLHFAAKWGSAGSIDLLASNGADLNIKDFSKSWSPIFYGVSESHVCCVESLINHGADVNAVDSSRLTPIFHGMHSFECVELLVNNGANLNYANRYGKTPIFYAVERRNVQLIQLLIENGANVDHIDNLGMTPLFSAINNADDQVVQLLLNHCSILESEVYRNYSALDLAKRIQQLELREHILSRIEQKILDKNIIADSADAVAMLSF